MDFKDYYKILEVNRTATQAEIKKSYRRLAMLYHPDRNKNNPKAEERFKEIAEAYAVLSDVDKRQKYDQISGYQSQQTSTSYDSESYRHTGSWYNEDYSDDEDLYEEPQDSSKFSEFFKNFFSRFKSSRYSDNYDHLFKGEDLHGKITIDLEEAYLGSTRILNMNYEKLRLKVKPGIKNEQILKIKEHGKESKYGDARGDLYVRIVIKPHPYFERRKNDLYCKLDVNIFKALLGGKVSLKTFKGEMSINIPRGTPHGKVLRLKGMGMPDYEFPQLYGDLYVKIRHKIPAKFTDHQVQLLQELSEN